MLSPISKPSGQMHLQSARLVTLVAFVTLVSLVAFVTLVALPPAMSAAGNEVRMKPAKHLQSDSLVAASNSVVEWSGHLTHANIVSALKFGL